MTEKNILDWANTCMEFFYKDLGYTKNQVLHSVVHLDEKTSHIYCVKKFDKRTNTERYTISKNKYHKRLTDKGYDLERGSKVVIENILKSKIIRR